MHLYSTMNLFMSQVEYYLVFIIKWTVHNHNKKKKYLKTILILSFPVQPKATVQIKFVQLRNKVCEKNS